MFPFTPFTQQYKNISTTIYQQLENIYTFLFTRVCIAWKIGRDKKGIQPSPTIPKGSEKSLNRW